MRLTDLAVIERGRTGEQAEMLWLVGSQPQPKGDKRPRRTHLIRLNTVGMFLPLCGVERIDDPKHTDNPMIHVDCRSCLSRLT